MIVKIKKLHDDAVVPKYQTEGASGFDMHSIKEYTVYAGQVLLVDTGIAFEIPSGYELQVRPRSGLSFKTPLRVANSPGTVDSDFRDSVKVIIENRSDNESYTIKKGERIAQGIICPVVQAQFVDTDTLSDTNRGIGGFGSTGK
jgi:dUTP pyrophosphatase